MIELTPEQVDLIVIELPENLSEQKKMSNMLRSYERKYLDTVKEADALLEKAQSVFK